MPFWFHSRNTKLYIYFTTSTCFVMGDFVEKLGLAADNAASPIERTQ